MQRFAAFLRGMNLGGRRITNHELCDHVRGLGFVDVAAFLASGNLVLTAEPDDPELIRERLEAGLQTSLGYSVPTFIRSATALRSLAGSKPFDSLDGGAAIGKPQVVLLREPPSPTARAKTLALASPVDRLAFGDCELFWLPRDGVSGSQLDWKEVERHLGPTTVRTQRTIDRLASKHF